MIARVIGDVLKSSDRSSIYQFFVPTFQSSVVHIQLDCSEQQSTVHITIQILQV